MRADGASVLAARALAHLVEALPAAAANIVRSEAVPTLCDKLMITEFIDLKEQIILTLEKLSLEHPTALLRAGAVAAIFTFLDFFDIGVQRTAMSTIANICRQVPSDQMHLFTDVLGQLTDMLQYPDQKSTPPVHA
jgi:E3 ubiquitin-protein ligase TRIP12